MIDQEHLRRLSSASMPQIFAKDILSVQPLTAPSGRIFKMRYSYSVETAVRLSVDSWFEGYSDHRTMMHPYKYGDMYLTHDMYFFKIKLKGL